MTPCCRRRCSPRTGSRWRRRCVRWFRRHLAAVGVDDLDDGAARRATGGAGDGAQLVGHRDRRLCDLGRAVEVVDVVAEQVHPAQRQLARQRGPARRDDAQRAGVVLADDLGRQRDDPLHHHRHHREHLGAVLVDRAQGVLGIEAGSHDQRVGQHRPEQQVQTAPRVEHRCGVEGLLADAQRHAPEQPDEGVEALALDGALRALRRAGRAGGEDGGAAEARRLRQLAGRLARREVVERRIRHRSAGVRDEALLVGRSLLDDRAELLVVEHHVRAFARHHLGELRCREAGVEQQRVGAELVQRRHREDEAAMVAREQADPVARLDARRREPVGDRVRRALDLRVRHRRAGLVDQPDLVRAPGGRGPQACRRRRAPLAERLAQVEQERGVEHAGAAEDLEGLVESPEGAALAGSA